MNRQWLLNLGLLFLALALVGVVVLKPGKQTDVSTRVAGIDPEQIGTIRIERPTGSTITLQKTGSGWRLISPVSARADVPVINNLLAISRAESLKHLPYAPGQDAVRYGFVNPRMTIHFENEVMQFGDTSPLTQQQYLLYNRHLHLVSADFLWSIPRHHEQFIDKRLLDISDTPSAIEFGRHQTLQLENGSWKLVPANPALAADTLTQVVNEWMYARALKVTSVGSDVPEDTVTFRYRDGKTMAIGVLRRPSELVLVRKDEGLQFHFSSAIASRLFPPASPPSK